MNDKYDNMSYKECRTSIKEIIENSTDKSAAKAFFSVDGRNYTQTKTDDMKLNLKAWFNKVVGKKESEQELKPAKQKVEETIESEVVKEESLDEIEEDIKTGIGDLVESVKEPVGPVDILMLLENIINNLKDLAKNPYVYSLEIKELDEVNTIQNIINSIRNRIVNERKIESKKSNLNEEAKAMSREFNDLMNL